MANVLAEELVRIKMTSSLTRTINRHWAAHRPEMYRELQAIGQLEAAIADAENRACDVESQALQNGLSPDQARELARQEWCLTAENDEDSPA